MTTFSSVHGILLARVLEWVAILFSRGSARPKDQTIAGKFFITEPPRKPHRRHRDKQISRDLAQVEGIGKEIEKMMIVERITLKLPNGNISDKIYPSFHSEGCRAVN